MKQSLVLMMLAAFALAGGCAAVKMVGGKASEKLGDGISAYCGADAETREVVRATVNADAYPNSITVECAGDGSGEAGPRDSGTE
jgi:hypothetical protein